MPGFSITGGVTFGSGFRFSADPDPITATAGSVTSVSGATGTAITSFFPFSSVQNGIAPYTYFVSAGVLPTGITLNSSTGLVSGTPTVAQGLGNVTFTVRDSNNVLASTTATVGFSITLTTYTINYLLVAGGGGSGGGASISPGSSGGGGGFLSGTSCLAFGRTYTMTVGAGGGAGVQGISFTCTGATRGTPGGNTTITASCFSTITAIGGGGGGAGGICGLTQGLPGGSGGGGAMQGPPRASSGGGLAVGSPGYGIAGTQGFPGAAAGPGSPSPANMPGDRGGSGGGAGGAGVSTNIPAGTPCVNMRAAGGPGATWPFTGPTVFYAGGGSYCTTSFPVGGGGAATFGAPPQPGIQGNNNSGGGGGVYRTGFNSPVWRGGAQGGPGVAILVIPTPRYTGTFTGPSVAVTTPPFAPGQVVLTFNSTGTYTA